jgi:hypothetical protein
MGAEGHLLEDPEARRRGLSFSLHCLDTSCSPVPSVRLSFSACGESRDSLLSGPLFPGTSGRCGHLLVYASWVNVRVYTPCLVPLSREEVCTWGLVSLLSGKQQVLSECLLVG